MWGTGVCICAFWICPHSCGPDVHIFLPFVSSNFLPSRQRKCLQRHRLAFFVMERRKKPHAFWRSAQIGILLYTCWYQFSFPTPWAASDILSKELNFGKFIGYFPSVGSLFCYLDSLSTVDGRWPLISCKILVKLLIWDQWLLRITQNSILGQTTTEMLWPFSPLCCPLLHPDLSEQYGNVLFISLILSSCCRSW